MKMRNMGLNDMIRDERKTEKRERESHLVNLVVR
jgi:hypothetical protein